MKERPISPFSVVEDTGKHCAVDRGLSPWADARASVARIGGGCGNDEGGKFYQRPASFHYKRFLLSRQNEKFLIEQSRKFLLTGVSLKDGTDRDEPKRNGTGWNG